MTNDSPTVSLGKVIQHRKEFIRINDLDNYKRVRVQLHAKGIVLRDTIVGSEIRTKTQQVCRAGEFLVAEIDAKGGGFGVVPAELEGSIVSSHYFLFQINKERLDRRFLDYFVRTPTFRDQVKARGSTNYAAIRPYHVLQYQIPLPPLPDQRRIVARIEELAAKIEEARSLKESINLTCHRMLLANFSEVISGAKSKPMNEVAPITRRPVEVETDRDYPELGIRSFGKGTFHKAALRGIDVGTKKLFRIEPGDLLFNNVFAWEGAIAVAKPADAGRFGSHRFIACVPKKGVATANFLCFYFLTEEGLEKLGKASPGGAGCNRTLGLNALASIEVPLPLYEKQLSFDRLQAKVDALKHIQAGTTTELNAMLPSFVDKAFKGRLL